MVIEKAKKTWQTNNMFPAENFTEHPDREVWVVPDGSAVAEKIRALHPHWDPVLDADGNLIDVADNDPDAAVRLALRKAQADARRVRKPLLAAFDIYKTNVFYGIETETDEERTEILAWYAALLDAPQTVAAGDAVCLPAPPEKISRYLEAGHD